MKQSEMPKFDSDGGVPHNFADTPSDKKHRSSADVEERHVANSRPEAGARHQPAIIASVGQTEAQLPQSVHKSGSIQRRPFFSLIASTGHSESQAAQLTQASVTL